MNAPHGRLNVISPAGGAMRRIARLVAILALLAATAQAGQVRVTTSGALTAAYLELVPDAARALIAFLASGSAVAAITRSGLEPVGVLSKPQ